MPSVEAAPPPPAPRPQQCRFLGVMPSLAVQDVDRSLDFYRRLGFHVAAQLPPSGRAEWLRLERDQVVILIWNEVIASPEVRQAISQSRGAGNTVRIAVSDVDRLARELQDNGIVLRHAPETMPEGERELTVVDPDGFVIEFASRPAPQSAGAGAP